MEIVCASCSARHNVPEDRVGERGAKLKCPTCGVVLVIFPAENVAMAADSEPTTEDWSTELPSGNVPAEVKRLFTGEQVHPPGTVPPVQRLVVPRAPDGQLSVTPPPPRAARAPLTPSHMLRSSRPMSGAVVEAARNRLTGDPSPRRVTPPPEPVIPPPALLDDHPKAGPASPSDAATMPPAADRVPPPITAPGMRNRTGPTAGSSPMRGPAPAPQGPPMSYAPPWGASVPTGTPAYPMQWTGTPAPMAGTPGPPMITTWQPAWVPAVVLGMEKTTLAMLLAVVLLVGFVGSCMGVGTSRLMPSTAPMGPPQMVPGTFDVRRPQPVAPRPVPAERSRGSRDRRPLPAPIVVPVPSRPPFDVESDDLRDPWAEP